MMEEYAMFQSRFVESAVKKNNEICQIIHNVLRAKNGNSWRDLCQRINRYNWQNAFKRFTQCKII